jgi:hypothetical protein
MQIPINAGILNKGWSFMEIEKEQDYTQTLIS